MTIQIELWQVISLSLSFLACVGAFGRVLLSQAEKRLDERFLAQEKTRQEELKRVDEQLGQLSGQISNQEQARETGKQHWDDQFSEIDRKLSDHRERIGRLETAVETAPSHKHLADLHKRINGIAEDVSSLSGEFKGAKHTLELIHSFLMNGGKA